jgi:hypothetical protein
MNVLRMSEQDLAGKRVLIRQDLNVPVEGGKVTSDARIRASLPTIQLALDKGARVFVTSHLGRPEEGVYAEEFSLAPVASRLSELLGKPVLLKKDWLGGVDTAPGSAVLLENVRFHKGEKKDKEELSRQMAGLFDVFVMDAFGTAHRAEASTHGVGEFAKVACAGPRSWVSSRRWNGRLRNRRSDDRHVAGSKVPQAHGARVAADQGGQAHRGWRHRQHLPGCHRHQRGQVTAGSRDARYRTTAAGPGQGARRGNPAAHRRGRCQGIRGHSARRRAQHP